MTDEPISVDQFRREVEGACTILASYGFRRGVQFDTATPLTASVVYLGKNVAFTFALDLRDRCVDLYVTSVRKGKLTVDGREGYSSRVFTHLVKYCGFRGLITHADSFLAGASELRRMVLAQVSLLEHPSSASLLADGADSLPSGANHENHRGETSDP